MRYGNIFPLFLITGLTAQGQPAPGNVAATILYASALHGWAIPPYEAHPPFRGITVFCTVVVDNGSGRTLTMPVPRAADTNGPRASVFNGLKLTVCDDAGKALNSYYYLYQECSGTKFYAGLLPGRSTNELYYLVAETPTNKVATFRLEGKIGLAGSITSNIVSVRLN